MHLATASLRGGQRYHRTGPGGSGDQETTSGASRGGRSIPAIVWSALPDGSNSYVNSRYVEYCGMSPEQIAGSGWHAVTHPDDLERHKAKWLACVANGEPFENEVRFRRADGQYRWHLHRGVPLREKVEMSSNGMASSPTLKIGSGPRKRFANRKQNFGRCWTSRLNLLRYTDPTANVSMSIASHLITWVLVSRSGGGHSSGAFVHPDDRERELAYFARARSDGSAWPVGIAITRGRWKLSLVSGSLQPGSRRQGTDPALVRCMYRYRRPQAG